MFFMPITHQYCSSMFVSADFSNSDRIVLGVDPGTNVMGYGVVRIEGRKIEYVAMGIVDMRKIDDPYLKLKTIHNKTIEIIEEFLPDEFAIEAQFFGKNVQSMLKLGRAQGVAIAAAIHHDVPIHEYAPLKIKMAITGQGQASKEQVASMLQRMLHISDTDMPKFMDATDALGAAYCHFLQMGRPETNAKHYSSWKDFAVKNQGRVEGGKAVTGPRAQLLAALNRTTHK